MKHIVVFLIAVFKTPDEIPNVWNIGGVIGGLVALIGAMKWIWDYKLKDKETVLNHNLERAKLEDKKDEDRIELLKEEIDKLRTSLKNSNLKIEELEKLAEQKNKIAIEERDLKEGVLRELAAAHLTLDMFEIFLDEITGDNPKAREYFKAIQEKTKKRKYKGNITPA